jgi:hypothetical protein
VPDIKAATIAFNDLSEAHGFRWLTRTLTHDLLHHKCAKHLSKRGERSCVTLLERLGREHVLDPAQPMLCYSSASRARYASMSPPPNSSTSS